MTNREIDALVAEHVMEWTNLITITGDPKPIPFIIGTAPGTKGHLPIPEYSTDISAAWEVVKELMPNCTQFTLDLELCSKVNSFVSLLKEHLIAALK